MLYPGTAASIILPKNRGNKLVVNADKPIKINAKTNFARYGFRYLKRMSACEMFSRVIFALGVPLFSLLSLRDFAIDKLYVKQKECF